MVFKKGNIPWNAGLAGQEICKKIGFKSLGKPSWAKGKKFTDDHRRKISSGLKGRKLNFTVWNKGIKRTDIIGKNNGNWKGGLTSETVKRLNTPEWDLVRRKCLKRDKYRCQRCKIINVKLDVHHMIPWRISKDNRLNNLISVCRKCHKYIEGRFIG